MSVENKNVIDVVSIDEDGNAVLTISDHLEWDEENEHLLVLQDKINAYLGAIENGELYKIYPEAEGRTIIIRVFALYSPNREALIFLHQVKEVLEAAGYKFYFEEKSEPW